MKNNINVAVIHFQPLEKYPPVMNLLNYFEKEGLSPLVFSNGTTTISYKYSGVESQRIFRFAQFPIKSKLSRLWSYIGFSSYVLRKMLREKPNVVLYYESLSALPAILYKLLRPSISLMVHYHEYTTPEEYKREMVMNRLAHRLEIKFIRKYDWISHTNEDRLEMYKNDYSLPSELNYRIMPNYPPRSWGELSKKSAHKPEGSIKLVYCGALGMRSTFVNELLHWVNERAGEVKLDIYSHQLEEEVLNMLNSQEHPHATFKGSVEYFELPKILPAYDAGLILYNGHIQNYVYNAPNKLFEYLSCGIDVWFPKEVKGCVPYMNTNSKPKVLQIDFNALKEVNAHKLVSTEALPNSTEGYHCETVYEKLKDFMLSG